MANRERLSATVEADILAAGRRAVSDGRTSSLSAWVNDALRRQAEHDRHLKAADDFFRWYEAKYGVITEEEIRQATRRTRARAIRVRPREPARRPGPKRRRGAA